MKKHYLVTLKWRNNPGDPWRDENKVVETVCIGVWWNWFLERSGKARDQLVEDVKTEGLEGTIAGSVPNTEWVFLSAVEISEVGYQMLAKRLEED